MNDIELPKLKVKLSKAEIKELRDRRNTKIIVFFSFVVLLVILGGIGFYIYSIHNKKVILKNETSIISLDISSYNKEENYININLQASNEQELCSFSKDEDIEKLSFEPMKDGVCTLIVPFEKVNIYFKNKEGIVSDPLELNNYVVDFNVKDKYYLPLNSSGDLLKNAIVVGSPILEVNGNADILIMDKFKYTSGKQGKTYLTITNGELQKKEVEITVTNTIVKMPKEFDSKKKFLTCEQFSESEASLLDEILEYRIAEAGYGTRAGAVAAARFLTLEFPYRISYYFENGRLNGTGTHYVDGEGRYYHKGLYLSKSKYNQLVPGAKLKGPKMWGCKMVSYEDDRENGYYPGGKYPNGLDCSGFVSWTLLNGGFDVGDGGAGESPAIRGQMTDTGDYRRLTQGMINRGEVRVGDLLNIYGHIAIIIGDDGDNFYVAESLNNYKGVVMKKYSKKKVINWFPYVVLMDSVYESDGNLTNMWY